MTQTFRLDWPYAFGGPSGTGIIKTQPEDFIVEEILPFTPDGSGEHVFLHIEKRGENTDFLARRLARHAGVRQQDIGFAGLKDRHGQTSQWFSVWLPGREEPDWQALADENLKILQITRHARKLKRGALSGNHFTITLRACQADPVIVEQQLINIQTQGFPNYFGEQRFGRDGRNLEKALTMFQGSRVKREQRSIYLSAARSYLFNLVLAERVTKQSWNCGLNGEILQLAGTHSHFHANEFDATLSERLKNADIHTTGPLYGKGQSLVGGEVLALEQNIFFTQPEFADGLIKAGLINERRALRSLPQHLSWEWQDKNLQLSFGLTAGSYATALLREIVATENGQD